MVGGQLSEHSDDRLGNHCPTTRHPEIGRSSINGSAKTIWPQQNFEENMVMKNEELRIKNEECFRHYRPFLLLILNSSFLILLCVSVLKTVANAQDITVGLSNSLINEIAKQFIGLEIKLANGNKLRITSIDTTMTGGGGIVKIGITADSTVDVKLLLTGRLDNAQLINNEFRVPFTVTDIDVVNNKLASLFLKVFLGGWDSKEKWNKELPPISLPIEFGDFITIPSNKITTPGPPPIEIGTAQYKSPFKLKPVHLIFLESKAVLGLSLTDNSTQPTQSTDWQAIQSSTEDLDLHMNSRIIKKVLEHIASQHKDDFDILLKPGRLRLEHVDMMVKKIENYTDVESGNGKADITQLTIDKITDNKVLVKLSGQGFVDSKLKGRDYGVPYSLSPRTAFTINDGMLPLKFISDGNRIYLSAQQDASIPINLRFSIKVAGKDLGISRNSSVKADQWLKRIEIPTISGYEFLLPQKMEIDTAGNMITTAQQKSIVTLSNMRVDANNNTVRLRSKVELKVKN